MQKKLIAIAVLTLGISSGAWAISLGPENVNTNANANTQGQHQGQAQGQFQGQGQLQGQASFNKNSANSNSGGNGFSSYNETDIRPAATAAAPGLTSIGTDNCLGSTSFGAGNGFFAVSGGTTTESAECNRRAYSRALLGLGQKAAALALLCKNEEVASVTPACAKASAPVAATPAAPVLVASSPTADNAAVCASAKAQGDTILVSRVCK